MTIVLCVRTVAEVDGPLRLVRVRGGEYREARETARATEDLWHGLQKLVGLDPPIPLRPFMVLALEPGPPKGVYFIRGTSSDILPIQLVIRGDFEGRAEELSEQLGRIALWHWTGRSGDPFRSRADWLAVGLAQNLVPFRRSRNRVLTWERAERGELPSVQDILYWIRMPSGSMTEKAICGHFVAWCLAEPDGRTRLTALLGAMEGGKELSPARAHEILSAGRTNDLERTWKTWAFRREGVPAGGLSLTPFLVRQARKTAGIPSSDLGLSALLGEERLSPFQALALRRHPMMAGAVQNRVRELGLAAIGVPEDLASVLLSYQRCYLQMMGWTPSFLLRRKFFDLDQELAFLEDRSQSLRLWLDEWDSEVLLEGLGISQMD